MSDGSITISVLRHDGQTEVLTLVDPVSIVGSSIVSGTGMSHHFVDGLYDGWSMPCDFAVPEGEDPLEHVMPFIQAIEDEREIGGEPKS